MLHTYLTTSWHLRYPIIGAPMAYVGRGRLAHAVSQAGGLGMIGIGSTESVDFLAREAAIARGTDPLSLTHLEPSRTWHPQGPIHPQPSPVPLHFGGLPPPRRRHGARRHVVARG